MCGYKKVTVPPETIHQFFEYDDTKKYDRISSIL